jgi:hypothetical protein
MINSQSKVSPISQIANVDKNLKHERMTPLLKGESVITLIF